MSLIDKLRSYFSTSEQTADKQSDLDQLRELLARKERDLNLTAVYGEPYARTDVGAETIVFPYTLFHEGTPYGSGHKEFVIPDDGLADKESSLVRFLTLIHEVDSDAVTFDHVAGVTGIETEAEFDSGGDLFVNP